METFQIILEGQCLAGFDAAQVRAELAKLVGQTEAIAGQLLRGREVVVKTHVDIVSGTRYVEALRSIGVAARVAPEVLDLDDDLAERLMNPKPAIAATRSERSTIPEQTQPPKPVATHQYGKATSEQPKAFGWFALVVIAIAVTVGVYAAFPSSGRVDKEVPTAPAPAIPAKVDPSKVQWDTPPQKVPAEDHNPYAGISRGSTSGMDWIAISGEISQAMATEFDLTLREMRAEQPKKLILVWLNSKGGDLAAAMEIGRSIRNDDKNAATSVGVKEHDVCFSSCVFILAGGDTRLRAGRIGIHRPYFTQPISNGDDAKRLFDKLSTDAKAYLREMNVRESLFDDMVSIPPEDLHIFQSWEEMDRYGLLAKDPIEAEKEAAAFMQRYGIPSKSLYYERKQQVDNECQDPNVYLNCMERVMRGG